MLLRRTGCRRHGSPYALGPDIPIEVLPGDRRHFQFMDDRRLSNRTTGFFVGAVNFGDEAAREKAYRDSLDGLFVANGASRHITQRIAGFPVFDILMLPIKRSEASQSPLQGGSLLQEGRALP